MGPTVVISLIAIVILAASIWGWLYFVRNDPQNVFQSMLANNLRTSSVTRKVSQESGGQKLEQITRLQTRNQHVAQSLATVTQPGENDEETVVVTETIGTPTLDYVRYVKIETGQKDSDGEPLKFDDVLNVWAVSESNEGQALGDLYGDAALGVFPFADLPAEQRSELLKLIDENDVYQVDYNKAKQFNENGRAYFSYSVAVKPSAYVTMLKQFARNVGITQLESIDPKNYENAQELTFNVTVDILSQRLVRINSVGGERQELFGGYGIHQEVNIPEQTIPILELQNRLQSTTSV